MESLSRASGNASEQTVTRPCEIFHVIGGAGTGGLIAILLVVLEMTAAEALEEFTKLVGEVFKSETVDPKKRTEKLQRVIGSIMERCRLDSDLRLISTNHGHTPPTCRLIVPVMYKNHVGVPCVLRNYVVRHEPPTNLTVAEAMLATCTTPPTFTPFTTYKEFGDFEYIGGEVGLSNPTKEVIAEAHRAFSGDATVACLLSIGSGHLGINFSPHDLGAATWIDFLDRVSMRSENMAGEMAAQTQHLTLYHRFSVEYGLEARKPRPGMDLTILAAHTTSYLSGGEVIGKLGLCVSTIKHGDGFTTLEQLRYSGGSKVLPPTPPPLTSHYVERKEATEFIEKALLEEDGTIKPGSKIVVVTGIGGCGKTQLVRKFVKQHGDRFVTTFFVDGSSEGSIQRDIVRYVRSLGVAHSQSFFDDSMRFLSQRVNGERLLVVDNVADPTVDLAPCLPRWPNGAVVVTSRDASRGQLSTRAHLELDVMTLDEAVELLVCGSGREWPPSQSNKEAFVAVAKELGCHPIAIVQAISYMANTGYSAETYIARLRAFREPVLNNPATNQLNMRYKTAFAAFDASYEILPPPAQKALQLLSLFHWRNFCLELVVLAGENGFSTEKYNYIPRGEEFECGKEHLTTIFCSSGVWNPLELDLVVASLRNHSLVTTVSTGNATLLQMHPLVHEWARLRGTPDELEKSRDAAVRLLCCGTTEDHHYILQYLYPHIEALSVAWGSLHANDALSFAFILHEAGLYKGACELREAALDSVKNLLGVDHLFTIATSVDIADTYCQLGRYADAEELETTVHRQRTERLGPDHPYTVRAAGNLAETYDRLGRYVEAQALKEDVLRQTTELLGANHLDTILASGNLAVSYRQLGRYVEAQRLQEEVLRQRTRMLGVDHPHTIIASGSLATTYHELGHYSEAQALEEMVVQQLRKLLGADHPHTIVASGNLAATYCRMGNYAAAQMLEEEALRQSRQLLGVDHHRTILASGNLAVTYSQLGRYAEAQALEQEVVLQLRNQLGVDHPNTIRASANLAATYRHLGNYVEAQRLEEEVLRQRTQMLGEDHPDTVSASRGLAATYFSVGNYAEAQRLEEGVLRKRIEMLGVDHPDTIAASVSLAKTYDKLGRYAEAKSLEEEVLRQQTRLLGADHLDTISASANLASTYCQLGCYTEARRLEEEVLLKRTQLLGTDHPHTISASGSLAATCRQLGNYVEAQRLEEEVLRQRTQMLGADHPDTIVASGNLAVTYGQVGDYAAAQTLEEEVLRQSRQLLGSDHPNTIVASANLAVTYRQLGYYVEAQRLEEEVLRQRTQMLGADHPDTITACLSLAETYDKLGRCVEAQALEEEVLRRTTELLGANHPDTVLASGNLAVTYRHLGRYVEAQRLEEEVLGQRTQLLGEDHPHTIRAAGNLAITYSKMGRYVDAERLGTQALQQYTRISGADDPNTLWAVRNLAATYRELGRYQEAEALETDGLMRTTATQGERHPDALRMMYALAQTYKAMGRRSEAIGLATNASQALLDSLGEAHPLYLEVSAFLSSLSESPPVGSRRRHRAMGHVRRIFSGRFFRSLLRRQI